MSRLHDPQVRGALKTRVQALRADSPRKWGTMSADQMMWHVSQALDLCMGNLSGGIEKAPPLPKPILRFLVLSVPWPKGAPTSKVTKAAGEKRDFEAERARCLRLIDEFAARPIDGQWPLHPILGRMSGDQYSRLQAKHLNHHLTQFST